MDKGNQLLDGVGEVQQQKQKLSGKVCFASRVIPKHENDFYGYYIFIVELSELAKESMRVEKSFLLKLGVGTSVCGIDSTLYITDSSSNDSREVYSLNIHTQTKAQLSADDLHTLPPMWFRKNTALMTPIPGTKKILVFSSMFSMCFFPHVATSGGDDVDDDKDDGIDFEIYNPETIEWERLPSLIIRTRWDGNQLSYFLLKSYRDNRGTKIQYIDRDEKFKRFSISRYTFIDKNTVFLVQLSSGTKLTLDLKAPSKVWKPYSEGEPRSSSDRNLFVVKEKVQKPWCASDIVGDFGNFGNVVSFPRSSFREDDQVKFPISSTLTLLEGENHVCIVQGGVSRKTKHSQVIIDVVDVKDMNKPELVASGGFVVTRVFRRFLTLCAFVYHPEQTHI